MNLTVSSASKLVLGVGMTLLVFTLFRRKAVSISVFPSLVDEYPTVYCVELLVTHLTFRIFSAPDSVVYVSTNVWLSICVIPYSVFLSVEVC